MVKMCTGLEAELQGRRDSQCQGILFPWKIAIIVWNKADNGLSLELVRDFHSPCTADYRKDHKKNSSSLWGRQSPRNLLQIQLYLYRCEMVSGQQKLFNLIFFWVKIEYFQKQLMSEASDAKRKECVYERQKQNSRKWQDRPNSY